jgi:predicted transcriptional regulator
MTIMSIQLDDKLKKVIDQFSEEDRVSRSMAVGRLLNQAAWQRTWKNMSWQVHQKLDELDLGDIDEIEKYSE